MIAIGSDHGGFALKEGLKNHLIEKGYEVLDLGCYSEKSVDYPHYGKAVGEAVVGGQADCGIVCCGSGMGIAMAANKVHGVRCATPFTPYMAEMAKRHNNANMLSFGGRIMTLTDAVALCDIWLNTEFEGGRHERRVDLINEM